MWLDREVLLGGMLFFLAGWFDEVRCDSHEGWGWGVVGVQFLEVLVKWVYDR